MYDISELRCSACGVSFQPTEGGLCASCGKPFCVIDLFSVGKGAEARRLCEGCKGSLPGVRGTNFLLADRRRLVKGLAGLKAADAGPRKK